MTVGADLQNKIWSKHMRHMRQDGFGMMCWLAFLIFNDFVRMFVILELILERTCMSWADSAPLHRAERY